MDHFLQNDSRYSFTSLLILSSLRGLTRLSRDMIVNPVTATERAHQRFARHCFHTLHQVLLIN